jgi:hypothetical protein
VVTTLGATWAINVTLTPDAAAPSATLLGTTTAYFNNGSASFTDLRITHAGTHQLTFQIHEPTTVTVATTSISIVVSTRTVDFAITSSSSLLTHGSDVALSLQLQNSIGGVLEAMGYKGHTYTATFNLDDTSGVYGNVSATGTLSHTFTSTDETITGLQLTNTLNYNKYIIRVDVTTTPALYNLVQYTGAIQFHDSGATAHLQQASGSSVTLKLAGQNYRSGSRMARTTLTSDQIATNTFQAFVYNYLTNVVAGGAYIGSVSVTDSGTDTQVTATVNGQDSASVDAAVARITTAFSTSGSVFSYKGTTYSNADLTCVVSTSGTCTSITGSSSTDTSTTTSSSTGVASWIIIVICLVISVILGAIIIMTTCYVKKRDSSYRFDEKRGKTNPMDCTAGTGSQSTIGTNLLRLSPGAQSPGSHINDGYRTIDSRASTEHRSIPSRPISSASSDTIENLPRVET